MKNLIKKITRPFFDFSNPGHRIKKFVHTVYKVLVAIAAGLGAIPGAIFGGALGVYISTAIGALVMTAGRAITNFEESQLEVYATIGTLIGIIVGILVVPLLAAIGLLITGFIIGFVTIISLWFPYILMYAYGELVENSNRISSNKIQFETNQTNNYESENIKGNNIHNHEKNTKIDFEKEDSENIIAHKKRRNLFSFLSSDLFFILAISIALIICFIIFFWFLFSYIL